MQRKSMFLKLKIIQSNLMKLIKVHLEFILV